VLALLAASWGMPVDAAPVGSGALATQQADRPKDPRTSRGLFVDPKMPAYQRGGVYRAKLGSYAQSLWIIPEAYPTGQVRDIVRAYTSRALAANKTPVLTVYGIPGRDCGMYSSGNPLTTAADYRAWVKQISRGLVDQDAIVILEPDALPLFSSSLAACPTKPDGWLGMLRSASRLLSASKAWVYLDAGHSDWRPYDTRPLMLVKAGIKYTRGFSTNVANYRTTADEKAYAAEMLKGLRQLKVKGMHYVIDTSRNGNPNPVNGDVTNPTWALVGKPPRLVLDGAFDGTLWVKHPGESDGQVNGGGPSGHWCDMLADRLLGRTPQLSYCPQ